MQNIRKIEIDVNHMIQAKWIKCKSVLDVICDRKVSLYDLQFV